MVDVLVGVVTGSDERRESGTNSFWCLFFQARTFFISHHMVLTMEKMRATTVTTRKAPST